MSQLQVGSLLLTNSLSIFALVSLCLTILLDFNFQRDVISRCISELEINAGLQDIKYFSLSNHFCMLVNSKLARYRQNLLWLQLGKKLERTGNFFV